MLMQCSMSLSHASLMAECKTVRLAERKLQNGPSLEASLETT